MGKYVMALDQGTTSSRCLLFDSDGQPRAMAQREFLQIYPQPGWVEHDAEEIWWTQLAVAREAMAKVGADAADIAAIGITNQRETTIVWEKGSARPVYNALVWQCRRTADAAARLAQEGLAEDIRKKTGLVVDAYFSATKLAWLLDNVPGCRERANRGELLFGTVESYLIYRLTGRHVMECGNASRTMLFNIHTGEWDDELLALFDIPRAMLPEVAGSSEVYGYTKEELFGGAITVCGAAGDQQAALFGQACFEKGMLKNTYGTGCFLLMNTGGVPVDSKNGLLTTVAWRLSGKMTYALEGSIFVAGAAVQWLRDELKLIEKAADTDWWAQQAGDTAGVYVVPAFTGLGAPHWDGYARGAILGLTRGAGKAQIIRATLESIAYQVEDVFRAMRQDAGVKLSYVRVDGGASANDFLMRFQADISNVTVLRPKCVESTALGAAGLAGLAAGFYDTAKLAEQPADRIFAPQMDEAVRAGKLAGWHKAVSRAKAWAE